MNRLKLTPHQRIVRAAKRRTGLYLSADEAWHLGVMDDAISTAARNDDERAESPDGKCHADEAPE